MAPVGIDAEQARGEVQGLPAVVPAGLVCTTLLASHSFIILLSSIRWPFNLARLWVLTFTTDC